MVCLYISFKLSPLEVSARTLCEYTDDCYTVGEVLAWEVLVLTRLGWRVDPPTPLSVLDSVLRATGTQRLRSKALDVVVMSAGDVQLSTADSWTVVLAAIDIVYEEAKTTTPDSCQALDGIRLPAVDIDSLVAVERTSLQAVDSGSLAAVDSSCLTVVDKRSLETVKRQLQQLLLEDVDSDYGSSRGSDFFLDDGFVYEHLPVLKGLDPAYVITAGN